MSDAFWPLLLIVAAIIVYAAAKIVVYMRQSERQWRDVDKSKLQEWDEEDDW